MPCYLPVMQFGHDSKLRERLYRAYVTRASDQADGDLTRFDNDAIIRELLALRREEARLLGYDNFAEVSLVPKMAKSPAEVATFLRELASKARPHAERDLADSLRTLNLTPMSRKSSHASRGNGSPFGNFSGRLKTMAVRGSSGVQGASSTSVP